MIDLNEAKTSTNIAELLSKEELQKISRQVLDGLEIDENSRYEWLEHSRKSLELAKLSTEKKSSPWEGASNIKFPLITKACIDFASRTLPEIVQNNRIVKHKIIGKDPDGLKARRGHRIERHMNYQLNHQMDDWEAGLDKLLHVYSNIGLAYRKNYYDFCEKANRSDVCFPDKVVVNNNIQTLEDAPRISHLVEKSLNEIIEYMRAGVYLDIDLDKITSIDNNDPDSPIELVEQHCFLDLDEDKYKEPYVVILHKDSGYILNISHRFKKIKRNAKDQIEKIIARNYFTAYHFIPSPDGGFHSIGLGTILAHTNETINTLFNQLIDAGTLNNMQSGFIGRGVRIKNGDVKLKLGEWKVVEASVGEDIAKNIVPVPTKEPSSTLFQLLGLLIETGKDLASINDVLQGKQPAQNVPATTVLTLVEQGLKVFNAVHKRLFRALASDFEKLFELNREFLTQEEYQLILDDPIANKDEDYAIADLDIRPVANPNMSSTAQKLGIAQALLSLPTLNPTEQTKKYLEALDLDEEDIQKLLTPPPPGIENARAEAEVRKLHADSEKALAEAEALRGVVQIKAQGSQVAAVDAETRRAEALARIDKMKVDSKVNEAKTVIANESSLVEEQLKQAELAVKREKNLIDADQKRQELSKKDSKDS